MFAGIIVSFLMGCLCGFILHYNSNHEQIDLKKENEKLRKENQLLWDKVEITTNLSDIN